MRRFILASLLLLHGCAPNVRQDTGMIAVAAFGWLEQDVDSIIEGGPFDRSFSAGIYPYKEVAIERWFRMVVPVGTTKDRAKMILNTSFSVDLTSGKKVVIERKSGPAGSQNTNVVLHFVEDKLHDVEVQQHWAYL